jgi:hypothetical protein
MRVVGEAQIVRHACEVCLAFGDAVECEPDPQPVPVVANGALAEPGEDAAEVVW